MADPITPPDVLVAIDAARSRSPLALVVRYLESTTSTMDRAGEAVNEGVPEGYAVIAGEQTSGRGRRGRAWQSPPGAGLYCSIVFRPGLDAVGQRAQSLMTLAAGVAARRAIGAATGLWPDLKWPNDLLVGRRKLAGILAEGHDLGSDRAAVVVDRATSLEAELGRAISRGVVLEHLLVALALVYDELRRGDADAILREWRAAAPSAVGARVEWGSGSQARHGATAGIDADGALLIRTATAIERFVGGELRWS